MSLETRDGDTPLTFDSPELWTPQEPASPAPPASEPSGDTKPAATTPEAATVPPVESAPADAKPRESVAPIPFERHKAILEDERKLRSEIEGKLGWATALIQEGHSPEQVQRALAIASGLKGNAVGFIEQLLTEAAANPSLAGQVRSAAARVLGSRGFQAEQPEPQDIEPQPDLYMDNGDGTRTLVRSDKNLHEWRAWEKRQDAKALDERFAPLEQARKQIEERNAQELADQEFRAERQKLIDDGQKFLEEIKSEPYYSPEFLKAMQDYAKSKDFRVTIQDACLYALRTVAVPTLTQTGRTQAEADLRTKAAASSVNPKGAASGVTTGPKGFFDPNLKW